MEHAPKMALVDPRLLDTLRSPQPPQTDTLGKKVQALDCDMMSILDRKDLDDRTKVTLYNQALQRYNVAVNESKPADLGAGAGAGAPAAEEAVAPSSGIQADVMGTVPKTMQTKVRR